MDARRVTDDIVVLREPNDRAVLVKGRKHYTAIDIPGERESLTELLEASRKLAYGGINLAILTHDVDDSGLGDGLAPMRVVRSDRKSDSDGKWDTVPSRLLNHKRHTVQLVRERRTIHDDTGRAFRLEPCAGQPNTPGTPARFATPPVKSSAKNA